MLESYKNKNNLLDVNWYLSKMSMFLKESYGIVDEIKWDIDLLNNMNDICDTIMYSLDIYSLIFPTFKVTYEGKEIEITCYEDYMAYLDKLNEGKQEDEKNYYQPLEMIASLVGISKDVKLKVGDNSYNWVRLTNYELWQYVLITIARNNFNGTFEEITKVYERTHLNVFYFTTAPMKCDICIKDNDDLSQNVKNLLQHGNILIQSMGIEYSVKFYRENNESFRLDENNLDNYRYILR